MFNCDNEALVFVLNKQSSKDPQIMYLVRLGADTGFQVRGGVHLKKLRRAEGGAKIFGVFRVKDHDFTPKNQIFPILGRAREIFGIFHV